MIQWIFNCVYPFLHIFLKKNLRSPSLPAMKAMPQAGYKMVRTMQWCGCLLQNKIVVALYIFIGDVFMCASCSMLNQVPTTMSRLLKQRCAVVSACIAMKKQGVDLPTNQ